MPRSAACSHCCECARWRLALLPILAGPLAPLIDWTVMLCFVLFHQAKGACRKRRLFWPALPGRVWDARALICSVRRARMSRLHLSMPFGLWPRR